MNKLQFKNFCNALGIKRGDNLMIHGNISAINQFNFNTKFNIKQKLDTFYKELKNRISTKGNILIPSFTYNFCKKKFVNLDNNTSEVGMFSELSRKLRYGNRTSHPIFSFKVFGNGYKYFENSNHNTCFGLESLFDRFNKINGKIIFLGCELDRMTFIHFVEESFKVKYRYIKKINGKIQFKKKIKKVNVNYFVRKLNSKKKLNLRSLYDLMIKYNKIKSFELGRYNVILVEAKDIQKYAMKGLKKNINFLVK